jgi:hypothetical protein
LISAGPISEDRIKQGSTDIVAAIVSEQLSQALLKEQFWRMFIPFFLYLIELASHGAYPISQPSPGRRRQIWHAKRPANKRGGKNRPSLERLGLLAEAAHSP